MSVGQRSQLTAPGCFKELKKSIKKTVHIDSNSPFILGTPFALAWQNKFDVKNYTKEWWIEL